MNRRQFLRYSAVSTFSLTFGNLSSYKRSPATPISAGDEAILKGMQIIDAHAHPITLKQIVEMSSKPLVDSHTSPCPVETSSSI